VKQGSCLGSRSEAGFLSIPMGMMLTILGTTTVILITLMQSWSHQTRLQLRLDRCVAQISHSLKEKVDSIESDNANMSRLRALIMPLMGAPAAAEALQAALKAVWIHQEFLLRSWDIGRIRWLANRGCGQAGDFGRPLPALPWERPIEDPIGPKPLVWPANAPHELHIEAGHSGGRGSAALVYKEDSVESPPQAPDSPSSNNIDRPALQAIPVFSLVHELPPGALGESDASSGKASWKATNWKERWDRPTGLFRAITH